MKKIIATTLLLGASLFAEDGYKVYQETCKACHVEMISVAETMKQMKTLKAPPMIEVSHQLKETIIIKGDKADDEDIHRFTTIAFIKNYLQRPSIDYFMCNAGAVDRFGVMPAQSDLNDEERQAVAEWIYDRYEDVEFK